MAMINSKIRNASKLALVFAVVSLSGCVIFAPFIQAWKNVGATSADRIALFEPRLKRFGEAIYWSKGEAALFIDKSAPDEVRKTLTTEHENIRIVESRPKHVEYSADTFTAEVELLVRYYRIPFYIVTDSLEHQTWVFHVGDNWYLKDRKIAKEFLK